MSETRKRTSGHYPIVHIDRSQFVPGERAVEVGEGPCTIIECAEWVCFANDCGITIRVDSDGELVTTSPAGLDMTRSVVL